MKKAILIFIFSIFVISCSSEIQGEGEIKTKTLPFQESFSELSSDIKGNVRLLQADSVGIRIEAQQNVIDNLDIELKSGELSIKEKNEVTKADLYEVFVYYTATPQKVSTKGFGEVIFNQPLKTEEFELFASDNAKVKNLTLEVKDLEVELKDNSEAKIEGSATTFFIKSGDKSVGQFEYLKSNEVKFNATGNTQIWVNSEKELKGEAGDNATIRYLGNPEKDVDTKDRAEVIPEGNF